MWHDILLFPHWYMKIYEYYFSYSQQNIINTRVVLEGNLHNLFVIVALPHGCHWQQAII